MAEKVLMKALSPTMETGTIAKWHKKEGEEIQRNEVLCEVETDKATMEFECRQEGTLLKILIDQGDDASIGQPIAILGSKGENIDSLLEEIKKEQEGSKQKAKEEEKKEKAKAPSQDKEKREPATQKERKTASATDEKTGGIKASPLARRLAEQQNIDLASLEGSGPGGRIIKRDIEAAPSAATTAAAAPALEDKEVPVSQKRKVIAERLAESKYSAPHYYLKLSIKMDGLLAARKEHNARVKPEEKLSLNAYLVKFVAEALKRHPQVNASWEGKNIRHFGSADIGLAVAQEDGLITPVVKNCVNKGIKQIDAELKTLIDKARNNKLQQQEYSGATFTISSLGSFGIEEFTAIINPPGSAILAVGQTQKVPVVQDNDEIKIESLMKVTLSCDHRVIDGAVGAKFLHDLKQMIENPLLALY